MAKNTDSKTTMVLNRVMITRGGINSWDRIDPASPFRATIEVQGASGKVELNLGHDLSRRIVEIIAEEVAAAGRATAEAMVADAMLIDGGAQKTIAA